MEHLFKLKKDGKTVGYLKIRGGNILGSIDGKRFTFVTEQNQSRGIYLYRDIGRPFIDYDTAHPFVTKDKNSKDVFAGDTVKADKWYFEVIWQKYGFGLKGKKSGWWRQFHEFEDIELIEEK